MKKKKNGREPFTPIRSCGCHGTAKILWTITGAVSNPESLLEMWKSYLVQCYEMEGHAKKCVERYCELANKTTQQLYKVATPCFDDHQFKEEEVGSVGDLTNVCSQSVWKCMYLGSIGRPDTLWSVNKLARAATNWTGACAKRLARLISYEHHTSEFKHYCHVGNNAQQCRLGLFQDSDFASDPEDSNSTSGGLLVHIWKSYLCFNKLDVQETNFSFTQLNGR